MHVVNLDEIKLSLSIEIYTYSSILGLVHACMYVCVKSSEVIEWSKVVKAVIVVKLVKNKIKSGQSARPNWSTVVKVFVAFNCGGSRQRSHSAQSGQKRFKAVKVVKSAQSDQSG